MLERVPLDKKDWKPHEKSMTLGRLASHVADVTHWISDIISIDDFDFTKDFNFNPRIATTSEELLELFQTTLDKAISDLSTVDETELEKKLDSQKGRTGNVCDLKKNFYPQLDNESHDTSSRPVICLFAFAGCSRAWNVWPKCR